MRTRSGLWPVIFLLFMLPACKEDRQRGVGDAAPEMAEYQKALERLDEVDRAER